MMQVGEVLARTVAQTMQVWLCSTIFYFAAETVSRFGSKACCNQAYITNYYSDALGPVQTPGHPDS